jgi:TolB-like protein/tetratricopeptide (TPR) repeat protein
LRCGCVRRCLAKDPDERYQSIKEVAIELKELRRDLAAAGDPDVTVTPTTTSNATGEAGRSEVASQTAGDPTSGSTSDQGLSLSSQPSSAEYLVSGIKRHKRAALIALLVLVGTAVGLFLLLRARPTKDAIESIAVMPFVNASGNADLEYLSDGMTETPISGLSQLPNMNVKPRSSVFRYKGKELNVEAILNGRVVQRGQELSLFVELIDVGLDKVVWSQQYNRKQTDLVTLQSEIARDVSSKLKSKLSGVDEAKVTKNYTANSEAYQLYLKGRFQWNKRTGESLKQSVEFYNQAIEKDPNYALAYSGLAESYVLFPNYSVALPQECMPKAKAAAVRAIEIDDSLAEAHVALGLYLSIFSWNQPVAEREFRRAIELNPNYPSAHQQLANYCLMAMGRFDEAIAEGRRAEELDPLSPIISSDVGANLTRARRLDEAIAQFNRTLTLDPNFYSARYALATAYHAKGNYAEAIAEYRKALALNDDPWVKALLARSLAKSGNLTKPLNCSANYNQNRRVAMFRVPVLRWSLARLARKTKPLPGWKKTLPSARRVRRYFQSILYSMTCVMTLVFRICYTASRWRKEIELDERRTHRGNEGDQMVEAIDEALRLGKAANTPVHIVYHTETWHRQSFSGGAGS